MVADFLEYLNITTRVKAVSYDLNFNGYPESIEYSTSLPMIYMYPFGKKYDAPIRYQGKNLAGEMLKFMETNSGLGYEFPFDLTKIGLKKED